MIDFLLDANIISDLINNSRGHARQHARRVGYSRLGTSIIAAVEVRFGYVRKGSAPLTTASEAVLDSLVILPFESPADRRYAELRWSLQRAGTPISPNDMLIAAHALALDCTLVTANEREFRRVPGLKVENWLTPVDI